MKKVLSVVLAIIMMFSITISAFAAEKTVIEDKKTTVTVGDEVVKFTFTPSKNAVYKLSAKIINDGFANVLVFYDDMYINGCMLFRVDKYKDAYEENYSYISNILTYCNEDVIYFCGEKGKKLELEFINCRKDYFDGLDKLFTEDAKIEFTVTSAGVPVAKLGKNTVDADGTVFSFTPSNTGYYNFRSTDKVNDPYIDVNDISGTIGFNDDIGYEDDFNFDLTVWLEKGKAYALDCGNYERDEDIELTSYSFTISYNKTIKAEQVGINLYSDEITLVRGDYDYYDLVVVPNGATPTTNVEAYVENDKIADVEYNTDGNSIVITGKRSGKTTLTVSSEDGLSTEYTIKVIPKIVGVVYEIYSAISVAFMKVVGVIRDLFTGALFK